MRWIFQGWRGYTNTVNSTKAHDPPEVYSVQLAPLNWSSSRRVTEGPVSAVLNQSDRVLINTLWSPITQASLWGSKQEKDLLKINGVPLSLHSHLVSRWQLWKIMGTRMKRDTGRGGRVEIKQEDTKSTRGILNKHNHVLHKAVNRSRMPLSYPIVILTVTHEPVYLWDAPNWCFWAFHNFPSLLFETCIKFTKSLYS